MITKRVGEGGGKMVGGGEEGLGMGGEGGGVGGGGGKYGGKRGAGPPVGMNGRPVGLGGHKGQAWIEVMTDSMGRALFRDVPYGEYALRSGMQREATAVLPNARLSVFRSQVDYRITAVMPARAAGIIRFDESELVEAVEREWARKRRPTYLVFEHEIGRAHV